MDWGAVFAGAVGGGANAAGQIADDQIKEQQAMRMAYQNAAMKVKMANEMAQMDAHTLAGAEDRVRQSRGAKSAGLLQSALPQGAADGLPPEMLNDMAAGDIDTSSSGYLRDLRNEVRKSGSASADLLARTDSDYLNTVKDERAGAAAASKDRYERMRDDAKDKDRDARERMASSHDDSRERAAEIRATRDRRYNSMSDEIKLLEGERKDYAEQTARAASLWDSKRKSLQEASGDLMQPKAKRDAASKELQDGQIEFDKTIKSLNDKKEQRSAEMGDLRKRMREMDGQPLGGASSGKISPIKSSDGFESALKTENADGDFANLARSVFTQESSGGVNNKISDRDAQGAMQVVPGTFNQVADKDWNIGNTNHNMRAGIRYLRQGWDEAGKITTDPVERAKLSAAYYHGGPGGMQAYRRGEVRSDGAKTTPNYANDVVGRMFAGGSNSKDNQAVAKGGNITDQLPTSGVKRGAQARDTQTGVIYVFDGSQWKAKA